MGDFSEFSLKIQLFLRAYRWRRIDRLVILSGAKELLMQPRQILRRSAPQSLP